jgi:hypothetical protein
MKTIPASLLFSGARYTLESPLHEWRFVSHEINQIEQQSFRSFAGTSMQSEVPQDGLKLQDEAILRWDSPNPFMVHIGGSNLFDGVQKERLTDGTDVLFWYEMKHSQPSTNDARVKTSDVDTMRKKLLIVENALPKFKHIVILVTNRSVDSLDDNLKKHNQLVIVSTNDRSFEFFMSPSLARRFIWETFNKNKK